MVVMMGNRLDILMKGVVIALLNLLPLLVYANPTIAPPTGPYISLHAFPVLADIRTISAIKPLPAAPFGKRLSTYQRPSHFNPTVSNRIPVRDRAALSASDESQQPGWHW